MWDLDVRDSITLSSKIILKVAISWCSLGKCHKGDTKLWLSDITSPGSHVLQTTKSCPPCFVEAKCKHPIIARGEPACLCSGMVQIFLLLLHCPGRSCSLCLFPECQGWMMLYLQSVSFQAQPPSGLNSSFLYKCFVSYNWILLKYAWHLYIVVGILNIQTNSI